MKYIQLHNFDPLVRKDIEDQLDSYVVFAGLHGFKFHTWSASRRIVIEFQKYKKILYDDDYYALNLTLLLNEEGTKITYVEVTEGLSFYEMRLLDRSTKFRYKNGELSGPIKQLLEKLGDGKW